MKSASARLDAATPANRTCRARASMRVRSRSRARARHRGQERSGRDGSRASASRRDPLSSSSGPAVSPVLADRGIEAIELALVPADLAASRPRSAAGPPPSPQPDQDGGEHADEDQAGLQPGRAPGGPPGGRG